MVRWGWLAFGLVLGGCTAGSMQAEMECAVYARAVTGLRLSGDAADWWAAAAGLYDRGPEPAPGRVLVFRRAGRVPHGHVSVVTAVVSAREIRVEQANWVHGQITRDEAVIDVSPANDWTAVRVWWAPSGTMGSTTYRTYGFIGRPEQAGGRAWPGGGDAALFACMVNRVAPCDVAYSGGARIGGDHG